MIRFEIVVGTAIGILLFLVCYLFALTSNIQKQIDEMRLLVDQKFLSAMLIDKPTIRETYGTTNY